MRDESKSKAFTLFAQGQHINPEIEEKTKIVYERLYKELEEVFALIQGVQVLLSIGGLENNDLEKIDLDLLVEVSETIQEAKKRLVFVMTEFVNLRPYLRSEEKDRLIVLALDCQTACERIVNFVRRIRERMEI